MASEGKISVVDELQKKATRKFGAAWQGNEADGLTIKMPRLALERRISERSEPGQ